MNQREKNFHAMVRSVLATFTEHAAVTTAPPVLPTFRDQLISTEARLNAARRREDDALEGITVQKDDLKRVMTQAVHPIAGMLQAYADVQDDEVLRAQADLSQSDIIQRADADSANLCADLMDKAADLTAPLADYGLDPDSLEAASDLVEEFGTLVGTPRQGIIRRRSAGQEIEDAIADARTILTQRLDPILRQFDVLPADPATTARKAFHDDYQGARIIVDTPGPEA